MVRARGPWFLFLALVALASAFAVFLASDREANGATFQWGDFDCSGGVSIGDAQKVARDLIGLPITQGPGCPTPGESVNVDGVFRFWGDIDCSEARTIGDAQKLARKLIGLPVAVAPDCPDAEEDVTIGTSGDVPDFL